jgi:hypothetical protein
MPLLPILPSFEELRRHLFFFFIDSRRGFLLADYCGTAVSFIVVWLGFEVHLMYSFIWKRRLSRMTSGCAVCAEDRDLLARTAASSFLFSFSSRSVSITVTFAGCKDKDTAVYLFILW